MSKGLIQNNSILEAVEQKIESQLTPKNRADYMKVVVAGMKAGLAGGHKSILASLLHSKDPIHDCAVGAVNLCLLLRKQSRGTMPLKAMVPAGLTLMLKALGFAEHSGLLKVDNDVVVKATHIFTNMMFQHFGITAPMLHTAMGKVQALTQDPAKVELLRRAAGVVKDPRASTPTPMPDGGANGPH